ncbi:Type-2Aa cytolytic delta-endotoxin [Streptomyces sp. T-3]|nr:Type-2Aa cytolytic delta-endotoxin [Streptomyces sp. T-3]
MVDQAAATTAVFKTVFEVGAQCADQLKLIEADFQEAIAPAAGGFEFGRIQAAATGVPDGTLVRIIPGFGLQETARPHVMVLTLTEAVRQALNQPFSNAAFWDKVDEALRGAFLGLGDQVGAPHFLPRPAADTDEPAQTSYDYNLLFALQDEETEGQLYVVAFCIHVTLGRTLDEVLNLSPDDVSRCTLRLDAFSVRQAVAS